MISANSSSVIDRNLYTRVEVYWSAVMELSLIPEVNVWKQAKKTTWLNPLSKSVLNIKYNIVIDGANLWNY